MSAFLESVFPNLAADGYRITSPSTPEYNCIAWAADEETLWWWPDPFGDYYWPQEAPRIETLEAFQAAYATRGYEPCADASLEPGFVKVAVYASTDAVPTHAARQLPSGRWSSKLGQAEDIEHATPESLSGAAYGTPCLFLRRATTPDADLR